MGFHSHPELRRAYDELEVLVDRANAYYPDRNLSEQREIVADTLLNYNQQAVHDVIKEYLIPLYHDICDSSWLDENSAVIDDYMGQRSLVFKSETPLDPEWIAIKLGRKCQAFFEDQCAIFPFKDEECFTVGGFPSFSHDFTTMITTLSDNAQIQSTAREFLYTDEEIGQRVARDKIIHLYSDLTEADEGIAWALKTFSDFYEKYIRFVQEIIDDASEVER